jgi:ABC-type Fe3+-hydroxamate transport system substrate-binding protein
MQGMKMDNRQQINGGNMKRCFSLIKILAITFLLATLVFTGCTTIQPPASAPASASQANQIKSSITLVPNTVTVKKEAEIKVYGSGFTPGTSVSIGMPGVVTPSKLSDSVWYGAQTANKYGAIEYTISLSSGLWSCIPATISEKEAPGVYTVIAINPEGEVATSPLYVIAAPPPPTPAATPKPSTPAATSK